MDVLEVPEGKKGRSDIPYPTLSDRDRCEWCDARIPQMLGFNITGYVIYTWSWNDNYYLFCSTSCGERYRRRFNPHIRIWEEVKGRNVHR